MNNKKILKLKKLINSYNLDGYLVSKNDAYFSEFASPDRLKAISNFSGSAGFAIILKKANYLFVDGRYTIQAKIEAGKFFKIIEVPKFTPKDILKTFKKKLTIGFDPQLFTNSTLNKKFSNTCNLFPITENLIDKIYKDKGRALANPFYCLNNKISGESMSSKINRLIKILKTKNIDNIFISAPENVAWLLNIRGKDNPNSPIPNCKIILTNKKKIYFFSCPKKIGRIKKNNKYKYFTFSTYKNFPRIIKELKGNSFSIDNSTCSVANENMANF